MGYRGGVSSVLPDGFTVGRKKTVFGDGLRGYPVLAGSRPFTVGYITGNGQKVLYLFQEKTDDSGIDTVNLVHALRGKNFVSTVRKIQM